MSVEAKLKGIFMYYVIVSIHFCSVEESNIRLKREWAVPLDGLRSISLQVDKPNVKFP